MSSQTKTTPRRSFQAEFGHALKTFKLAVSAKAASYETLSEAENVRKPKLHLGQARVFKNDKPFEIPDYEFSSTHENDLESSKLPKAIMGGSNEEWITVHNQEQMKSPGPYGNDAETNQIFSGTSSIQ